MRVLLDTHLLLWALASPSKLPAKARRRIQSDQVFVSAASIWEISIKTALGKLSANPKEVVSAIEPAGFDHLSVSAEHAATVVELVPVHEDPFDRILIAQARVEQMVLLTNDETLGVYGSVVEVV